jgi:hypothetical protein
MHYLHVKYSINIIKSIQPLIRKIASVLTAVVTVSAGESRLANASDPEVSVLTAALFVVIARTLTTCAQNRQ